MHQPKFSLSVRCEKCSPYVGEDSGGGMWQFDTVKKYTLFVIFMGEGSKYKMEQNEDGQFDLYEQSTGDRCGSTKEHNEWHFLVALSTFPEHVDLDEYVSEVADIIHEQHKKSEGYESSPNITSD